MKALTQRYSQANEMFGTTWYIIIMVMDIVLIAGPVYLITMLAMGNLPAIGDIVLIALCVISSIIASSKLQANF